MCGGGFGELFRIHAKVKSARTKPQMNVNAEIIFLVCLCEGNIWEGNV